VAGRPLDSREKWEKKGLQPRISRESLPGRPKDLRSPASSGRESIEPVWEQLGEKIAGLWWNGLPYAKSKRLGHSVCILKGPSFARGGQKEIWGGKKTFFLGGVAGMPKGWIGRGYIG